MANGIRKVDEKELVRAHVFSLLGEPAGGVLAMKKPGIDYDAIREYSKLSPLSTQKLQNLYAEAAAEGQAEGFEKALYGVLYMYGLGTTGYARLAKALSGVENAGDFMENANKAVAVAQKKSDTMVAYPSYPIHLPEMKIAGKIEGEPVAAPRVKGPAAQTPLEQQPAEPAVTAVKTTPEEGRKALVARGKQAPKTEFTLGATTWETTVQPERAKKIDVAIFDRNGTVQKMERNEDGMLSIIMKGGKKYTLSYEKNELLLKDSKGNMVAEYEIRRNLFGTPQAVTERIAPPADSPLALKGAKIDGRELAVEPMKSQPDELARQKRRERQAS